MMTKPTHSFRTLLLAMAASLTLSVAMPAKAAEHATLLERADPAATTHFDIYLPLTHRTELDKLLAAQQDPASPSFRHWLTPQQFDVAFGADKAAIARIAARMRAGGLQIDAINTHGLSVSGPVAAIERLFNTQLHEARFVSGTGAEIHRIAAASRLSLPAEISEANGIVPSFDTFIRASTHSRRIRGPVPLNRTSAVGPYYFTDLKEAYAYPAYTLLNGTGRHIGILISGGFQASDMTTYFNHEGLTPPSFTNIPIYGGAPFSVNGSGETHLDMQQSGGMAPKALIGIYNMPDLSDESTFAGLTKITQDNIADVVSMSFGEPEIFFTKAYNNGVDMTGFLRIYDDFFAQGSAQGITFVASSGDYGSSPVPALACLASGAKAGCGGFVATVEIPASSPHVTAVGGTNLKTTFTAGSKNSAYVSEEAFGDPVVGDPEFHTPAKGAEWGSGGGVSLFFAQPSWQALVTTASKFRSVPDLALHMGGCPSSAVQPCNASDSADVEVIGGQFVGVIGTSASAPAFAGLMALVDESVNQRVGNANPEIYALAKAQAGGGAKVFHTGITGNNGIYSAGTGYNYVLGNGTLHANVFINTTTPPGAAGIPGNPSNP
jgi:subtilase family serine protease